MHFLFILLFSRCATRLPSHCSFWNYPYHDLSSLSTNRPSTSVTWCEWHIAVKLEVTNPLHTEPYVSVVCTYAGIVLYVQWERHAVSWHTVLQLEKYHVPYLVLPICRWHRFRDVDLFVCLAAFAPSPINGTLWCDLWVVELVKLEFGHWSVLSTLIRTSIFTIQLSSRLLATVCSVRFHLCH